MGGDLRRRRVGGRGTKRGARPTVGSLDLWALSVSLSLDRERRERAYSLIAYRFLVCFFLTKEGERTEKGERRPDSKERKRERPRKKARSLTSDASENPAPSSSLLSGMKPGPSLPDKREHLYVCTHMLKRKTRGKSSFVSSPSDRPKSCCTFFRGGGGSANVR